jgi:hypothetical protein
MTAFATWVPRRPATLIVRWVRLFELPGSHPSGPLSTP